MARALRDDLRWRVLRASAEGASARSAAALFGIGVSSAIRWIVRSKIGESSPRPQGRKRGSRLDACPGFVFGINDERKDITLNEMVERLATERSMHIGRSALSDWRRGHGWTFKESPHMQWSRTGPTS